MSVYLLDTDHLSIIQRPVEPEYSHLMKRIGGCDLEEIAVSIISFHEQMLGWQAYLKRARTPESVVRGYEMFERIIADFAAMPVVPFDANAATVYSRLRADKTRISTMDLRIASIALATGMVLITRNTVDFEKVPGLQLQDWTVP